MTNPGPHPKLAFHMQFFHRPNLTLVNVLSGGNFSSFRGRLHFLNAVEVMS
jgi:hypothetical protein